MGHSKGEKVYCIPRMGKYTDIFIEFFEELGLNMIKAPETTSRTIKLGVKYSPEMICFPFKCTLGNFIECLENGATDLLMFSGCGPCRLKHYYIVQHLIMKEIGYKFNMYPIRSYSFMFDLKKLNPNNSYLRIAKIIRKYWARIKQMENTCNVQINTKEINIGLVGEFFSVLEDKINLDIVNRLEKKGVKVHTFVSIRGLVKDALESKFFIENKHLKEAKKYLNGKIGGHALANIRDTLYFTRNNIDGIVHLMPLSCAPEAIIEPALNKICYDANVPLLRLNIDETNSELNFETRIETFVELIKRKKCKKVI